MTHANLLRRLGMVLAMLFLVLPFGGTASATNGYFAAPSLPWTAPAMNICFGGEICGTGDTVIVDVPASSYIAWVRVYAHDNVGDHHRAELQLYIDLRFVGASDVLANGGYIIFPVNRTGSRIMFRSVKAGGGTEETVLQYIHIDNQCIADYCNGSPRPF